jgi:hypothetical protein
MEVVEPDLLHVEGSLDGGHEVECDGEQMQEEEELEHQLQQ